MAAQCARSLGVVATFRPVLRNVRVSSCPAAARQHVAVQQRRRASLAVRAAAETEAAGEPARTPAITDVVALPQICCMVLQSLPR